MTPIEIYIQFLENKITLEECIKELRIMGKGMLADTIMIIEQD